MATEYPKMATHSRQVNAVVLDELKTAGLVRLAPIEVKLGLPPGYYESLRGQGTDWEFSIKLVVLLEAALGAVIAAKLQNEAVRQHCERLSLEGRSSKLSLAVDLGLLTGEEREAFSTLATVRNRFAHRVANINGDLEQFAKGIPQAELASLCKKAMMVSKDLEGRVAFLWDQPHIPTLLRYILWTSGSMLLEAIAAQDLHAEVEATRRRSLEEATAKGFTLLDMFSGTGPMLLTAPA